MRKYCLKFSGINLAIAEMITNAITMLSMYWGLGTLSFGVLIAYSFPKKGPDHGTVTVARPVIKLTVQYNINIRAPAKSSLFFLTLLSCVTHLAGELLADILLSSIFFVGPKQRLFTGFRIKTVPVGSLFGEILFAAPSTIPRYFVIHPLLILAVKPPNSTVALAIGNAKIF